VKSGQYEESTPCAPPSAKRLMGATAKSTKSESATALRNVSSVLNVVAKQRSVQPKEQPAQPNATRLFCEMMYEKLMKIENEEEREMMQYEIYGLLMRPERLHHTHQYYRESQYRDSEGSEAMYANDTHNDGSLSVAGAIGSAMSSVDDGFSDVSSDYNNQEYYMM